jgi:hypothetical protein
MKTEEKKTLYYLLEKFFAFYDINGRDVVAKNPVALLLKNELSKKGRWKALPRGKPHKFRVS